MPFAVLPPQLRQPQLTAVVPEITKAPRPLTGLMQQMKEITQCACSRPQLVSDLLVGHRARNEVFNERDCFGHQEASPIETVDKNVADISDAMKPNDKLFG